MQGLVALRDAEDEAQYGGKSASLGRALRAGLPVPDGYALSVDAVSQIIKDNGKELPELSSLFPDSAAAIAVRSSAVGEDSETASFAGQHVSILNVMSSEAMLAAIQAVYDSAYAPEVLAYREKMGVTTKPAIAIALQAQIFSETAGVMFTRNPVSNNAERYIEASWGLGEAIVAGLVVPDTYRIANDGSIVERSAGDKDIQLVADPAGNAIEVDVEPQLVNALCLIDSQLQQLHQLALDCETVYGEALDIEWAFHQDRLFLLQCRGITR